MAYNNPWDESLPAGSAAANTLDTIIQNAKIDVRERLEDVVANFANDTDDPKRLVVTSGLEENRTDASDSNVSALVLGELFFATDTEALFIWTGSEWIKIAGSGEESGTVIVDMFSNRPDVGTVSVGTLFWARDSNVMYIKESDTSSWAQVNRQLEPETIYEEIADELVISPSSGSVLITHTLPVSFNPQNWVVEALRVRAREIGSTSFSGWYYKGYGTNLALTGGSFSVPGAVDAHIVGVGLRTTPTDGTTYDVLIEIQNDSGSFSADFQIQVALRQLPSAKQFNPNPNFTL